MRRLFKENWIAGSGISAIIAMLWLASPVPPVQQEAPLRSEVFPASVMYVTSGQPSFCSIGPPGVMTYVVIGSTAVATTSTVTTVCYLGTPPNGR